MSLDNTLLPLEVNVRALTNTKDQPSWVPALFYNNSLANSEDGLIVISIDVGEDDPWYTYNGQQYTVSRRNVYHRRKEEDDRSTN